MEGLRQADGSLHPVQQAMVDHHGSQCGFCTPGMVLVGRDLLKKMPNHDEDRIRHHIKGNICRCTGYQNIVKSIQAAAAEMNAAKEAAE